MDEKKSSLGLACKVLAAPSEEINGSPGKNNNLQTIAFVNV